jgi:hypothetical protein
MKDTTEMQDSTETIAAGDPYAAEGRRGPTWRGWVLSILVAILLSVTATLLLGGYVAFRSDSAIGAGMGSGGSGGGHSCCLSADTGK